MFQYEADDAHIVSLAAVSLERETYTCYHQKIHKYTF